MRLALTCAPGVEDLVEEELREAGARIPAAPLAFRGRAYGEVADVEAAARLLLDLRIPHRLGIVVGEGTIGSQADMHAFARSLTVEEWMAPGTAFAVRAKRQGEHPFRRPDLEREIGGTLHDRFAEAWGATPRVDLADPDLLMRVDVDGQMRAVAWVDLVGAESLHRRGWRRHEHPAALKATLASALLRMGGLPSLAKEPRKQGVHGSGAKEGEGPAVVDAMTGGGTLAIEAAWALAGVPPITLRRDNLLLWRAGPLRDRDPDDLLPLPPLPDDPTPPGPPDARIAPRALPLRTLRILAADRHPGWLDAARDNAHAAGVASAIGFLRARAETLPESAPGARLIVANPPYGVRIGKREEVQAAHRGVVEGAAKALTDGGRLAVVTTRLDLIEEAATRVGMAVAARRWVVTGDVEVGMGVVGRG